MKRLAVINVVGLTEALIGEHTPRIAALRRRSALARIRPALPAVTCTAQANYLTGGNPAQHGIVGNGWYNRELAEIQFWKQSNHLVQLPKIWDALRREAGAAPAPTVSNCFWWFNQYSTVDYALTPRPIYRADGGKVFDIYSWPYAIRPEIKKSLGEFPFFGFWGPAAGLRTPQGSADCATRWIAKAAQWLENRFAPTLNLVYLPHLDYNLQRHGVYARPLARGASASGGAASAVPVINPQILPDLRAIDEIVGELIQFFQAREVRVVLVSEYGLTNVESPIYPNRIFRERGWLAVKDELGLEILDAGASRVFAVADHQVAHIYLNDRSLERPVREALEQTPGVGAIWGDSEKSAAGLAHPRAGDLVAIADDHSWFSYYYWLDDARAPDFARTVDIHRKPGYDPVELFLDPKLASPKLRIAWRLLQKRLGMRILMDVIPLDATLVRGSHGRLPANPMEWPVMISDQQTPGTAEIESTEVFGRLLSLAIGGPPSHNGPPDGPDD